MNAILTSRKPLTRGHVLSLLASAFVVMSCTAYKPLSEKTGPVPHLALRPGHVIRVTLSDGKVISGIKIRSVDKDRIVGVQKVFSTTAGWSSTDRTISFTGIQKIERKKFSVLRTGGLIATGISVSMIIALIQLEREGFGF